MIGAGLVAVLLILSLVTGCGGDDGGAMEPASFEGQPWVLASGFDEPQDVAATRPSATFESGTVGGSTGCNSYSAPYSVDGDSLEIGQIASTLMGCLPPAERAGGLGYSPFLGRRSSAGRALHS